jgi:hypothetical protein
MVFWFAVWATLGFFIGRYLNTPGFYTLCGVAFAVPSLFSWPFIFPERVQQWMDE